MDHLTICDKCHQQRPVRWDQVECCYLCERCQKLSAYHEAMMYMTPEDRAEAQEELDQELTDGDS